MKIHNVIYDFNSDSHFPDSNVPWRIPETLLVLLLALAAGFLITFTGAGAGLQQLIFLLGGLVQDLVLLILVLIQVGRHQQTLAAIGLERFTWRQVFTGVTSGLAIMALVTLVLSLISSLWHYTPAPQPVTQMVLQGSGWNWVIPSGFLVGLLAPISEEVFFRGFCYPAFRRHFGLRAGIILNSCLFAFLHLDPIRFLPLALGGVLLTLLCERHRSLYPSLFAHSTWNLVMLVLVWSGNS